MLLSGYILVGLFLDVAEGLWRGGQLYIASPQIANDFQTYGALALAFLLTLTVVSFTRRDLRTWLGIGAFWILGFISDRAQYLPLWGSDLDERKFFSHI